MDHVRSANGKNVIDFMTSIDAMCNLFEKFNTDCMIESTFLGTLPEFQLRGVGYALSKYSLALAKELCRGIGVDALLPADRHRRPTVALATLSSNFSQKIAKTLGLETVATAWYTDFMYNGETYADRIGPVHPNCTLVAIVLED